MVRRYTPVEDTDATPAPPRRRSAADRRRPMSRELFTERFEQMVANVGIVIKGKDDVVRLALIALLAEGNMLFEDVPGTGKTMLARSIAQTINAAASRLSCTPDLLPADVTGSPVLDRKTGDFVFRRGPVFANIFLCDEINRATPKTQSGLLEAMQERTVTVDGVTHPLPSPFFVIATQNPIELAGTFPLPEAQLDRFLFKLSFGYPSEAAEAEVLRANRSGEAIERLHPVVETADVRDMITWAAGVTVSDAIEMYMVQLVQATRRDPALQLGASPRASLALQRAARAVAASEGRDDVIPDDVRRLVVPVLSHRLMLTPESELRQETVEQVIDRVVARVPVPMGLAADSGAGDRWAR